MTAAVRTTAPRIVVEGAAAADLGLVRHGVRLPWRLLGGRVGLGADAAGGRTADPSTPAGAPCVTIEVADGDVALAPLVDSGRLVLTDATCLPLAELERPELGRAEPGRGGDVDGGGRLTVRGELVTDPTAPTATAADWLRPGATLVVAQRPPLADEVTGPVVVLAPSSPTPQGIPAAVLRAALLATSATHPDVTVVDAPIWWRDADSDAALVAAVARSAGAPVRVLAHTDRAWLEAGAALDRGLEPVGLDPAVRTVLHRWRPPRTRRGVVVLLTGLSGSGKSTLASALVQRIESEGVRSVSLLDGDLVRRLLSSGLGFDRAGRDANVLRIGFVAAEVARHGGMAVCAPIAPFAQTRAEVRRMVCEVGDFVLVHVATPLEVCEQRDRKGLYAQARAGSLPEFTGISSPYEAPVDADLVVDTTGSTLEESLEQILGHLRDGGWLA
ncbi:adenylyl-sulfate kinase [Terrabacter sp. NPDC000476]|uniref:adenylyl-sulfate kinase n=1 Tax=Terrabacter sp. NPDC000476 TaxID=3154258 RepID=UPI00332CF5CB